LICGKCGAKRIDAQIGLEKTPQEYVLKMVEVFQGIKRVLKKEGTLWLNLGDSYCGSWGNYSGQNRGAGRQRKIVNGSQAENPAYKGKENWRPPTTSAPGLKPKDLVGIPWRIAFALQADGWYLRQDIIWHKPNPMPESVTDRCTKAHEYVFILTKSNKYYFNNGAIKEPASYNTHERVARAKLGQKSNPTNKHSGIRPRKLVNTGLNIKNNYSMDSALNIMPDTRNKRSVWTVANRPFRGAHFATFPPDLIEPMIKAGCPQGGVVLDPFMGAGTTAIVAKRLSRNFVGIELNPKYIEIAEKRLQDAFGMFR
jgi:DNA modification methylase